MSQLARIILYGDLSPKWFGMELCLIGGGRFSVTKCDGTPEDVLASCRHIAPCVFVVDGASLERFNAEAFCETVDFGRLIRVLVEIGDHNHSVTEQLVRMGYAGVLSSDAGTETANRAVQAIMAGEL